MSDEVRDMVKELHTAFGIFIKEWDDVKENGFRFCAGRAEKIQTIEKEVSLLRKTYAITVIVLALTFLFSSTISKLSAKQTADTPAVTQTVKK